MEKKKQEPKKETKDPLKEKDEKIKELTDDLQRLQAEFENFKKRCDKDNASFREYMNAVFIEKLLPFVDSFELALKNSEKHDDFKKGVELIFSQLYDILQKDGLRPINAEKEKFDPYKHEVLMTEKTENKDEDELITEELQKGYMFKDKVLRYAKVKVKKYEDENNKKHSTE